MAGTQRQCVLSSFQDSSALTTGHTQTDGQILPPPHRLASGLTATASLLAPKPTVWAGWGVGGGPALLLKWSEKAKERLVVSQRSIFTAAPARRQIGNADTGKEKHTEHPVFHGMNLIMSFLKASTWVTYMWCTCGPQHVDWFEQGRKSRLCNDSLIIKIGSLCLIVCLPQSSTWPVSAERRGLCPTPGWRCYDWTETKCPTSSCPPTGFSACGFSRAFTSNVQTSGTRNKNGFTVCHMDVLTIWLGLLHNTHTHTHKIWKLDFCFAGQLIVCEVKDRGAGNSFL